MAISSSILAWEIAWTEEPGRLQSTGLRKGCTWLSSQTTTTAAVIFSWTGSWHCPSRKPNLKFLLLAPDSESTLFVFRLFLPQLLFHSFSNCPRFLLLFSPILMRLEDWWFSSETEEESGSSDQPSACCLCINLLSVQFFSLLFWSIIVGWLNPFAHLENKSLSSASSSLTNTCLSKMYANTDVSFSALQV